MSLSTLSTIYGSTENSFVWGKLKLKPLDPEDGHLEEYCLKEDTVHIGSHPSNDVVILDYSGVGEYHCSLTVEYGSVVIRSCSGQETYIVRNDQTSTIVPDGGACILNCGDVIMLGPDWAKPELELVEALSTDGVWRNYTRLSDLLGFGGFGTVYKAQDPLSPPNTFCAVKSIRLHNCHRLEYAQREVENLKLNHPNICAFIDIFFENNRLDIVMEFVDGGDLFTYSEMKFSELCHKVDDYLNSFKQCQRDLNYQLCQAVKFIHSKGIIHRNIKPDNILVTSETHPVIKIIDFGISKSLNLYDANLTMDCGTLNYMAPEIRSSRCYDHKVDCYSVGQTVIDCFFLLDEDAKHCRDLNLLGTKYGEEVSSFVQSLIHHNPKERLSMLEALDHPWMQNYVPFHDFPEYTAMDEASNCQIPSTPNRNHKLASILEDDDESLCSNMVVSPVQHAPEYSLTTKSASNSRRLVRTSTQRILVEAPPSSDSMALSPTRTPKLKARHHPFLGAFSTARSKGDLVDQA